MRETGDKGHFVAIVEPREPPPGLDLQGAVNKE